MEQVLVADVALLILLFARQGESVVTLPLPEFHTPKSADGDDNNEGTIVLFVDKESR